MKKLLSILFFLTVCNYVRAQSAGRWYDHYDIISQLYTDMQQAYLFMGFDTTYYLSAPGSDIDPMPYSSVGQYIDPVRYIYFNYFADTDQIQVTAQDNYDVDSVRIQGTYLRQSYMPDSVVDTLIFSIGLSTHSYTIGAAEYPWVTNCINPNDLTSLENDTTMQLFAPAKQFVDSINRAVYSDNPESPRILWKELLNNSILPTQLDYTYPIMQNGQSTSFHVPAGNSFTITCTFKAGNAPAYGWGTGPYDFFFPNCGYYADYEYYTYEQDSDDNMSLLMYSNDTGDYYPTYYTDGVDHHAMGSTDINHYLAYAAYISCNSCKTIGETEGINNITNAKAIAVATPNPARNTLNIHYILPDVEKATITLTNIMGQLVATQQQDAKSGTAVFNISALPDGVYLYTINTIDSRTSGKVVVAH